MWSPPKIIASVLTWRGWNPRVIRAGSRLHKALLGRFGRTRVIGGDALVLTTRGWLTGRETSTPLFYARDARGLLVAASFAGSGTPPVWYRNLVAHPDVKATVAGHTAPYRARPLDAVEVEAAWPKLLDVYPTFARYLARARRTIPVIRLEPQEPRGPSADR
jgi:deazaflavin-dependent oxidoreductase (nitroreductase family)